MNKDFTEQYTKDDWIDEEPFFDGAMNVSDLPQNDEPIINSIIYANGDRYSGDIRNRKPSGQGFFTSADGERSGGEWEDGKLHGRGVRIWANGDKYVGYWQNDKPNGDGKYIYANGDEQTGRWKDGVFESEAGQIFTGGGTDSQIFWGLYGMTTLRQGYSAKMDTDCLRGIVPTIRSGYISSMTATTL